MRSSRRRAARRGGGHAAHVMPAPAISRFRSRSESRPLPLWVQMKHDGRVITSAFAPTSALAADRDGGRRIITTTSDADSLTIAVFCVMLVGARRARVHAWGVQGHCPVAWIATASHASAKQNVAWLLDLRISRTSPRGPTGISRTTRRSSWHLNIPANATSYDRDRDCLRQPSVAGRGPTSGGTARWTASGNKDRLADATLDRADRAIAEVPRPLRRRLPSTVPRPRVGHGGNDIGLGIRLGDVWIESVQPARRRDGALIAHRGLDDARMRRRSTSDPRRG